MKPLHAILVYFALYLGASAREAVNTLAELRALPTEEAASGVPVRVEGVVLGLDPERVGDFFLHDGTAGCVIHLANEGRPVKLVPGDQVRVEGRAEALGFYPSVREAHVQRLGKGEFPPPVKLSLGQLYSPEIDSQWVEVPAMVIGVAGADSKCCRLDLDVYGQSFKAEMPRDLDIEKKATALLQRAARLRGVMVTVCNRERQMTDRFFCISSCDSIIPTAHQAHDDAYPLLSVTQLLTGAPGAVSMVRVQGSVTQIAPSGFYLRDASGSTLVAAAIGYRFPPGTRVEAVGYGSVWPFRPILRAIQVKDLGKAPPMKPLPLDLKKGDITAMQAEWVTLDADFLGSQVGPLEVICHFRCGRYFFEAHHPKTRSGDYSALAVGDQVRLRGICELTTTRQVSHASLVDGFSILLPATGGIEIISRASWWTTQRLYVALGVMTSAAAIGALLAWTLRRQVKRQMALISSKLRIEVVSGERDRMARELHDTLEQHLSGVALQLDGLNDVVKENPGASSVLFFARRMLRFTRVEARRSVWDLRSKVLEDDGLRAAILSIVETAAGPAGPQIEVRTTGEEHALREGVDSHLLRIVQEATTNAIKHGEAHSIHIGLDYHTDQTVLTICDDGRGFDPAAANPVTGAHFGLLGMEERAGKIGAVLSITSHPGQGCTVSVIVPNDTPPITL